MNSSLASARLPLVVALSLASLFSACGGGSDADVASSGNTAADVVGDVAHSPVATIAVGKSIESAANTVAAPVTATPSPAATPAAAATATEVPAMQLVEETAETAITAETVSYTVLPDEMLVNNLFTDALNGWTVGDAVLVNSTARPGGKAINVGWRALQSFAHGKLVPRATYTVKFRARNEKATGTTTVAMKFQILPYNENFRINKVEVKGTEWADYSFDFVAPAYTRSELSIIANGSRTIVDGVSIKMRSPIALTQTKAMPSGSLVPAGYAMVFNDEFNGTSLDRTKWHTRMIYNNGTADKLHDEKQRYRDNGNHVVANGMLSLVARKVSETDPNGVNYESGMIRSDWTSRYGFFEARVKMPAGKGVWPAFWLNSDVSETGRLSWPPEIDIFEYVNNGVEDKPDMLHSGVVTRPNSPSPVTFADPSYNLQYTFYRAPFKFDEGFHVIGAEWTPNQVTLYVDGKKIYTRGAPWIYEDGGAGGPAHILLNLAIGGAWPGRHGIDDTAFPQALQIDWVRAYKKL